MGMESIRSKRMKLRVVNQRYSDHYLSNFLINYVKKFDIRSYMEIGVATGRSLFAVVDNAPKLEQIYVCDSWTGKHGGCGATNHQHVDDRLRDFKGEVTYLDGDSKIVIPQWRRANPNTRIDLVTVDGDHDPVPAMTDLLNVSEFADVIVFDDLYHPGHKLAEVWEKFAMKQKHKTKFSLLYRKGHGVGCLGFVTPKRLRKGI